MSLFAKIALGVLVIAGVSFGVWNHNQKQLKQEDAIDQADISAKVNLTTGTANADLNADLKTIDGQLNVISNTSADIDQSMNDKPAIE